ncbi:MAG TPA: UDP-N-acetylglucosamine 2-epimerase (non-hydrolyzing) [Candidatus Angelobacter sp.]|nr:UDP-N-acetylglucosamine 2-epimerase (non-hydrolyzing) [Candidatus Angelobacter sp.]
MKVATVLGARPQFIKAAVVSKAISHSTDIEEIMVHTGQHYDDKMSEVFFQELDIARPAYNLGIGSGQHGFQTGRMLEAIESVLLEEIPDWVIVYGDTNSTLAAVLAAVKLHIPIAHVEAGLRSFDRRMPEEINRVLADHASDFLFTPTQAALHNLLREGLPDSSIHVVGDVMFDAAIYYGSKAKEHSEVLRNLSLRSRDYILATLHRAENTDDPECLRSILSGLAQMAREVPVMLPIHPRTRRILHDNGVLREISRYISVIDPLGYLDMMMLEQNARLIATDSGGVQKEAYFHGVPCVTFRESTEWVELIELGWNRLAPPVSAAAVLSGLHDGLESRPSPSESPYGDGHAAERIVQILLQTSGPSSRRTDGRDISTPARKLPGLARLRHSCPS